jgi:outer membrane biosynthesis protein TonB
VSARTPEPEPPAPEATIEAEPAGPEPTADAEPAQETAPETAPPLAAEPEPAAEPVAEPEPVPAPEAAPEPVPETPKPAPAPRPAPVPTPKRMETGYWLLSMFSPAQDDSVDWQRGSYTLVERGGRVDSPARAGDVKKIARMVEEGSVLLASAAPRGAAPDVAPDGFPHPVFRCGFALAVAIPVRGDR